MDATSLDEYTNRYSNKWAQLEDFQYGPGWQNKGKQGDTEVAVRMQGGVIAAKGTILIQAHIPKIFGGLVQRFSARKQWDEHIVEMFITDEQFPFYRDSYSRVSVGVPGLADRDVVVRALNRPIMKGPENGGFEAVAWGLSPEEMGPQDASRKTAARGAVRAGYKGG